MRELRRRERPTQKVRQVPARALLQRRVPARGVGRARARVRRGCERETGVQTARTAANADEGGKGRGEGERDAANSRDDVAASARGVAKRWRLDNGRFRRVDRGIRRRDRVRDRGGGSGVDSRGAVGAGEGVFRGEARG